MLFAAIIRNVLYYLIIRHHYIRDAQCVFFSADTDDRLLQASHCR